MVSSAAAALPGCSRLCLPPTLFAWLQVPGISTKARGKAEGQQTAARGEGARPRKRAEETHAMGNHQSSKGKSSKNYGGGQATGYKPQPQVRTQTLLALCTRSII